MTRKYCGITSYDPLSGGKTNAGSKKQEYRFYHDLFAHVDVYAGRFLCGGR